MEKFFKQGSGNMISRATIMSTTDATFAAQLGVRVEPEIVNMNPALDALRQRWSNKEVTNRQLAAFYTILSEIDFVSASNPFFAEGGCPPGIEYTKAQSSKVKKSFGVEAGLTNAAIAAINACDTQGLDNAILSEEERNMKVLDIAYRNSLDWAIINGDDSDPLAFDGLDAEITSAHGSLVVDLGGTNIVKSDIDTVIAVQALRGVRVSAIVSNPLMLNEIKNQYYPGLAVMSQDAQNNPFKYMSVPSVSGPVELVGDVHIPVTYVSGDNFTTTVYLLAETHNGVDLLYMDYLIPESIIPSWQFSGGSTCTSMGMGIYGIGTLVSRANVAQSKISNAGFSSSGDLNATITALTSKKV